MPQASFRKNNINLENSPTSQLVFLLKKFKCKCVIFLSCQSLLFLYVRIRIFFNCTYIKWNVATADETHKIVMNSQKNVTGFSPHFYSLYGKCMAMSFPLWAIPFFMKKETLYEKRLLEYLSKYGSLPICYILERHAISEPSLAICKLFKSTVSRFQPTRNWYWIVVKV